MAQSRDEKRELPREHRKLEERPSWHNPAIHHRPRVTVLWHGRQNLEIVLHAVHLLHGLREGKSSNQKMKKIK